MKKILNTKIKIRNWINLNKNGFKICGKDVDEQEVDEVNVRIVGLKKCYVRWLTDAEKEETGMKFDKREDLNEIDEMKKFMYEEKYDLIVMDELKNKYEMTLPGKIMDICLKPYVKSLDDSNISIDKIMTKIGFRKEDDKILDFECLGEVEVGD